MVKEENGDCLEMCSVEKEQWRSVPRKTPLLPARRFWLEGSVHCGVG